MTTATEFFKLDIDKKKETITFSTIIELDGRYLRLCYTRLAALFKEKEIETLFEWYFLYPKESFTDPRYAMCQWIRDTNYNKPGEWHELRWNEIKIDNKGHYLIISDAERSHQIAIPPNSFPETRYDYITADGKYRYDAKHKEFEGIEIIIPGKGATKEEEKKTKPTSLPDPALIDYYIIKEEIGLSIGLNPGDCLQPIEGSEFLEHWLEDRSVTPHEHILCQDQVHIKCLTVANVTPIYKEDIVIHGNDDHNPPDYETKKVLSPGAKDLLNKLVQDYKSRLVPEERILEEGDAAGLIYNLFNGVYSYSANQYKEIFNYLTSSIIKTETIVETKVKVEPKKEKEKTKRRDSDFKSFKEGETYQTYGSCGEPFKITQIVKVVRKDSEQIIKFIGEYINRPNLGICPILPELLIEKL